MNAKVIMVAFILLPLRTFATGLEYIGRCDPSSPPVPIVISADPRSQVTCLQHDQGTYLRMTQKIHISIGAQTYPLRDEWRVYGDTCAEALRAFREFPELQAVDPQSNTSLSLNLDRDYKALVIAFGLRRDACRAKGKMPFDLDSI
jgi:hypothetical protein